MQLFLNPGGAFNEKCPVLKGRAFLAGVAVCEEDEAAGALGERIMIVLVGQHVFWGKVPLIGK